MSYSTMTQTQEGVGVSSPIKFQRPMDNFEMLINVYVTGTVTYDIEYSIDDSANPQYVTLGDVDRSLSSDDSLYFPPRNIRVNVKTGTGTVKIVCMYKD